MGSQTAAGSSLALSAMLPSSFDTAGYVALTYVEIGQVEKLGSFGASFAKVEFQGLKGAKQKFKGSADFGALQPSIALDALDAGQILLQTASDDETQKLYSFRVTFPDGSARYFRGRVFGAPETADGADSMLMATPTVEICSKVVKLEAGVTPTPSPTLTKPSISPTSGAVGTTFTATDGTVTNGTITGRRWLLGTTAIGTGTTVTPNAAGSLTRENTAVGTNGETITSTSTTVTVSAATVTPTLSLSPTAPSVASNAAAGTLVSNITNVPAGVTPTVTPNDGRFVIAGDASAGWKIVVGMSALSAGTVNFSVAATGATGASGVLTVTAAAGGTTPNYTVFATPAAPTMPTTFTDIAASGDTTGATDLAAVNSAFAAGQNVRLTSAGGLYYANGPILQPGNTFFALPATGEWRLVAGSNSNVWKNSNQGTKTHTDKNVTVYGTGNFAFNGQPTLQTRQGNQRTNQCFVAISVENLIWRGFETVANASSMHTLGCLNVQIGNVKWNGTRSTPNQDGLDIGSGSSGFKIWNIRGSVGDDIFSFYAKQAQASNSMMGGTAWEGGADVSDIQIKDVQVAANLTNMLRLQAGDTYKMQGIHCWDLNNTLLTTADVGKVLIQLGEIFYLNDSGVPADGDMSDIYVDGCSGFSTYIAADSVGSNIVVKNVNQNVKLLQMVNAADTANDGKLKLLHDFIIDGVSASGAGLTQTHSQLVGNFRPGTNPYNIAIKNVALPNLARLINSVGAGVVNLNMTNVTITAATTDASVSAEPSSGILTNVTANGANIPLGTTGLRYAGATDTTAPTITTPSSGTVAENAAYSVPLTASEVGTWAAGSGDDTTQFTVVGSKERRWSLTLPAKDFETPTDTATSGSNSYIWRGTFTDESGNSTPFVHTVAILNDANEVAGEDPAFTSYKTQRTAPLTTTQAQRYNDFLAGLRADGTLAKMGRLVIFADEQNVTDAGINLVNPTGAKATPQNGMLFVANRGFKGDGSNQFVALSGIWSADGKFALDSGTMGVWCNEAGTTAAGAFPHLGCSASAFELVTANAAGTETYRVNGTANSNGRTGTTRLGHRIASRTTSSLTKAYYNGVLSATDSTTASNAISTGTACVGRSVTLYAPDQLAVAYSGAGITDAEATTIHGRLYTLLNSFGAAGF